MRIFSLSNITVTFKYTVFEMRNSAPFCHVLFHYKNNRGHKIALFSQIWFRSLPLYFYLTLEIYLFEV